MPSRRYVPNIFETLRNAEWDKASVTALAAYLIKISRTFQELIKHDAKWGTFAVNAPIMPLRSRFS